MLDLKTQQISGYINIDQNSYTHTFKEVKISQKR